ncbi:lmo0937 family membrane protein [Sapientia aquatica]|uniref:Lmo0937 family membrane protein n=1 Tax=Sapientia aquatica TaxID=1549640 RepID=A0A4R5W306_9BURK|nr:lmo0937 family membrane protein [Sapientia aquatica]TDK67093.1 lmo0937 family membrane protein [Sapientia aquatica]
MIYSLAFFLLLLWMLGLITSYTLGGFIHILLLIAIVMILLQVVTGRRAP